MGWLTKKGGINTYKPQSNNTDDVHEYVTALAKDDRVKRHKWLRTAEGKECIGVGLKGNVSIVERARADADLPRRRGIE